MLAAATAPLGAQAGQTLSVPADSPRWALQGEARPAEAQGFRDPGFLGIVNPENDAVYLPLKRGRNGLTLAVSELGGGWGFICRLGD